MPAFAGMTPAVELSWAKPAQGTLRARRRNETLAIGSPCIGGCRPPCLHESGGHGGPPPPFLSSLHMQGTEQTELLEQSRSAPSPGASIPTPSEAFSSARAPRRDPFMSLRRASRTAREPSRRLRQVPRCLLDRQSTPGRPSRSVSDGILRPPLEARTVARPHSDPPVTMAQRSRPLPKAAAGAAQAGAAQRVRSARTPLSLLVRGSLRRVGDCESHEVVPAARNA
jgi:hypothetical protein